MNIGHAGGPRITGRPTGARWTKLLVAAAATIALTVGVSACAGRDTTSAAPSATSDAGVTITHQYGETHIDGVPQRPVMIGASWADALVKLDVPIVGEFVAQSGTGTGGATSYPWTPKHDSQVSTYQVGSFPSVESVAALKPDVILVGALSDEGVYEQLSEIAPVIPVMTPGAAVDSWRDVTTAAGKIFDKQSEAEAAINEVEKLLADTKAKYPAIEGKTFAYGQLTTTNEIGVVTNPKSPSAQVLSDIGLTLDPDVQALSTTGERQVVSPERIDLLSADVLVFWPLSGSPDAFSAVAGWDDLPAVKGGTTVYLSNDTAAGFVTPTILSVPWAVDQLTPALENLK